MTTSKSGGLPSETSEGDERAIQEPGPEEMGELMATIEVGANGQGMGNLFERAKQAFTMDRDAARQRSFVPKTDRAADSVPRTSPAARTTE